MCAKGDHKKLGLIYKELYKEWKISFYTEIVYNKIQLLKYYIHEREA